MPLSVFDHAGVDRRHLCFDLEYYKHNRSFREKNDDYRTQGLAMVEHAVEAALDRANLTADQIDHIFFVTTTGVATPSLDAYLMNRMPFHRHVKRTPIFGLGCAGGAAGLSRASEYVRLFPKERALLVSLELCGQTFEPTDVSRVNLIASALFADGAACAVLENGRPGFEVVDTQSLFFPDSLGIMGWEIADTGFRLVLSPELPALMRRHAGNAVEGFLKPHGLSIEDVKHWIIHPGGPKVMDAFERALNLPADRLRHSRRFLREFGNLSSASVLFILEQVLPKGSAGEWGLLMAAGPGFSFEFLLLKSNFS
jgi:alkylresorcinol/alkylpyrone synthase